jgi:O-6-methylguanine DNA methyltransferase
MRTHLHDKSFVGYLQSFPGLGYFEYPFPVSSLYLFGDDDSLKFAFFGCALNDGRALEERFAGVKTASILKAVKFLDAYLDKKDAPLPAMDLSRFTVKQRKVYDKLLEVGWGGTVSYTDLAKRSGMPRAARFAGSCMAMNIFPVFIPCHRVIKTGGDMGNYSGGLEIKRFLLKHEGSFVP